MVLESSRVEMLAGDPAAAEHELRRGFNVLEELDERYVSLIARGPASADALWTQGRLDEAEDMTVVAEELSDPDDIDAQVIWRCLQAKVLASADRGRRGRGAGAQCDRRCSRPTDASSSRSWRSTAIWRGARLSGAAGGRRGSRRSSPSSTVGRGEGQLARTSHGCSTLSSAAVGALGSLPCG